jgi:hypothetical protein
MSGSVIEFHTNPDFVDVFPKPYPASRAVPDWLKRMPTASGDPDADTLKHCQPFLDAMTGGYIIPFPADMRISLSQKDGNTSIHLDMLSHGAPMVDAHPAQQFPGAPFAGRPVLKFINPWTVKTAPGYSCLFMAPVNRLDAPFHPLTGMVDTDLYYGQINFPCVCLMPFDIPVEVKAGTPMVQLIPFKRETWRSAHRGWEPDPHQAHADALSRNRHAYRDQFWAKKSYS